MAEQVASKRAAAVRASDRAAQEMVGEVAAEVARARERARVGREKARSGAGGVRVDLRGRGQPLGGAMVASQAEAWAEAFVRGREVPDDRHGDSGAGSGVSLLEGSGGLVGMGPRAVAVQMARVQAAASARRLAARRVASGVGVYEGGSEGDGEGGGDEGEGSGSEVVEWEGSVRVLDPESYDCLVLVMVPDAAREEVAEAVERGDDVELPEVRRVDDIVIITNIHS